MRQAHDHRVHAARGLTVRRILEAQLGQTLQVRVCTGDELTYVIVGTHPNHLERRMVQETAQKLRAGEPRSPEYRDFGLHGLDRSTRPPPRVGPRYSLSFVGTQNVRIVVAVPWRV